MTCKLIIHTVEQKAYTVKNQCQGESNNLHD